MTSQPIKSTMVKQIPKNVKHQLVAVTMSRHRDILCQYATNRKLPGHPPAYRRVASGSCLFVVLLSVLSLSRLSPWRGFLPRLTWTHQTPSPSPTYTPSRRSSLFRLHHLSLHCAVLNFAHASLNTWFCTSCCHFDGCFRFLLVFAIGMLRFLYPTLDPLAFVPNIFKKFTHILWFKFKPWFEQNRCFCIKTVFSTKSCFTQKPCYTQTQCFTQKPCSCWACARAVCGLQDSRNPWWPTPSREDHHPCIQFRCCRDTLGTIPPRRHSRPCQSKGRPGFNTQKINREKR